MAKKLYEESNIQAIADAIREKNNSTDTYTTSEMPGAILDIQGSDGSNADIFTLIDFIEGDIINMNLPNSISKIRSHGFYECENLTNLVIPDSVMEIGSHAFEGCVNLKSVLLSKNLNLIQAYLFRSCTSLESIVIHDNITSIYSFAFMFCNSLKSVTIPSSVTTLGSSVFYECTALEEVILGEGENTFNCNNLDLSVSTNYTQEMIYSWIKALYNRNITDENGERLPTYSLIIGEENLAKLTDEQIEEANLKNWNLIA